MTRNILIAGGGFSGTVLAAQLLRHPPPRPTRIVLVEPAARVGRGVAYADRRHPFLLNVPAGRMSANPTEPQEFLRFAQQRWAECTGEDFVPRAWYGDYLERCLTLAQREAPRHVQLEIIRARAVAVGQGSGEASLQVELDDGSTWLADEVVLATGNPPPARLPATRGLAAEHGYVHDPWAGPLEFSDGERLLLIGTSLTMADVLLAAEAAGQRPAVVHALSRHGFIPPPNSAFRPDALRGDGHAALFDAASSARRVFHAVRQLAADVERSGGDWREAVTFVRTVAPTLWQRMPEPERRRFLRHARTLWDVHRHRLPAATCDRIAEHRRSGWLQVHAGRVSAIEPGAAGLTVRWRARGSGEAQELQVDRIINCTGPDYDPRRSQDPLLQGLLRDGLVQPDSLGLGLRTGPHGVILDAAGRAVPRLYCLGPMLRADHWEATAALELREHAARLAAHLAGAA